MARGTIRERSGPTGKAWQIRAYNGTDPATGRRRYEARTIRGSRREAERALARLISEIEGGAHDGPDMPLEALLPKWMDLKTASWSPKTLLETRGMARRWIAPNRDDYPDRWRHCPGRHALVDVTPAILDTWHAWMARQGLSGSTIRRVAGANRAALEQAVRWGWILRNPAARTEPIPTDTAEIIPPDPDDIRRLLEHLIATEPEIAVLIRLAAITGRRRGEMAALRWTDIDLQAATATFTRTLADSENEGWVERPISKNRRRQPPMSLDPTTVTMLEAHRASTTAALAAADITAPDDAHVFVRVTPAGALAPWSPDGISRRFARVRSGVGLDTVRLHDLRHYVATSLLDAGIPATTVGGRLGHGSGGRTTTDVYAHWVQATDQASAAILARLLDGPD